MASHWARWIDWPCGAKPHEQSVAKYQPEPFALCGVFVWPVSNSTSARGAAASTESVVLLSGLPASIRYEPSHELNTEDIGVVALYGPE